MFASFPVGVYAMLGFLGIVLLVIGGLRAVGQSLTATGATPAASPRQGKTGEATVGQAHGKYYEASSIGQLFSCCEQGTGIAPGTALGTTAFFALYNPVGSGKRLAIKKVAVGYVSGTLGAGTLYHCVDKTPTQTAPSSGTALTVLCSDIGNSGVGVGVPRVNATVASSVVAYRPMCTLGASLASTANPPSNIVEDIDGEIVLEPGTSYQLQAVAAGGSSPKMTVGISWEEIPIV